MHRRPPEEHQSVAQAWYTFGEDAKKAGVLLSNRRLAYSTGTVLGGDPSMPILMDLLPQSAEVYCLLR